MATVNYPELLPHPLVSDGYGFRIQQNQAVGLFDVETQSRDETRSVNVAFTFTDLQYKVFHGWFMSVLIHGQKWFNMRLDGEFYECTFGGVQPQYSLNRKIITVTATLKTRQSTGFVNYTNQRVSYPDAVNYMPSPFDPSGWTGANDNDGIITNDNIINSSGEDFLGLATCITGSGGGWFPMNTSSEISILSGERVYIALYCKNINDDLSVYFRFGDSSGSYVAGAYIKINDGSNIRGDNLNTNFTLLGAGESLIEVEFTATVSQGMTALIAPKDSSGQDSPPADGAKLYVQAAFFGKTGKYQGAISYNAVNYMPSPFDPSGWFGATSDPDGDITNTTLGNPSGESFVGMAEQTGASFLILTNPSGISANAGEFVFTSILVKNVNLAPSIQVRIASDSGFLAAGRYSSIDGSYISGNNFETSVTELDGYILLQCKYELQSNATGVIGQHWLIDSSGSGVPAVGASLYVQAAYFGKADDWPAIITPADPDQFPAAITYEY